MKKICFALAMTFLGVFAVRSIGAMELEQVRRSVGALQIDQFPKVTNSQVPLGRLTAPFLTSQGACREINFTDKIKIKGETREITWKLSLNEKNQIGLSFRNQKLSSLEGIAAYLESFFADKEQFFYGERKIAKADIFPREIRVSLDNIVSLNFACNDIAEIDATLVKFITRLTNLKEINFSGNWLRFLPDDFLVNSSTIERVELQGNKLTKLPALLFNNMPALKIVSFDRNCLIRFPDNFLSNTPALAFFNCSYNQIVEFPEAFLSNAPRLATFICDYNKLKSFPPRFMVKSQEICSMSFEHNDIMALPLHFMVNATALCRLNGNDNQISAFPDGALANTPELERIMFRNNKLKTFHDNFLANAPKLLEVKLQNNQIVQFPAQFVGKSPHLYFINISDNKVSALPAALDKLDFDYRITFVTENNLLAQAFTARVSHFIGCGKVRYDRIKQLEVEERQKNLEAWEIFLAPNTAFEFFNESSLWYIESSPFAKFLKSDL